MGGKTLGEIAYRAYGNYREWYTWDNKPMPTWDDLGESIRAAWEAAANAVASEFVAPE